MEGEQIEFSSFFEIAAHNRKNGWVPAWKCRGCDSVVLWDNEEIQPECCCGKLMVLEGIEPEKVN